MPHPVSQSHLSAREAAESIVRQLQEAHHAAYFAGGCVRDRLLGLEPSDYDVATSAKPEEIKRLFKRTRAVGQHFGVMLVLIGHHQMEVATFRTDADYADGRRPAAVHFSTAEEDAQRRDFTINGLFFDPVQGQVVDYVGGEADLRAGILRAIGDPPRRFAEDHLRLLRAVRFAARFGLEIEPATWSAMQHMGGNLAGVSPERILEELDKIAQINPISSPFQGEVGKRSEPGEGAITNVETSKRQNAKTEITLALPSPCQGEGSLPVPHLHQARALQLIHDGGLMPSVMPEYLPFRQHLPLAIDTLSRLVSPCPLELMLAGWLSTARSAPSHPPTTDEKAALQKLAQKVTRRLRASNQLTESLSWLLVHHGDLTRDLELADLRLLRAAPCWPELLALMSARRTITCDPVAKVAQNLERAAQYPTPQSAQPAPLITGDLLLSRGFSPGPQLGKLLAEVYRAQLNETVRSVEDGLAMIARCER